MDEQVGMGVMILLVGNGSGEGNVSAFDLYDFVFSSVKILVASCRYNFL